MSEWCTFSPDGFLGVDWSLSCRAHAGLYRAGTNLLDKLKADLALFQDVWYISDMANAPWKRAVVKGYSVIQYAGTSTFGWFWWMKARIKDTDSTTL